jgi:hypothetical protein
MKSIRITDGITPDQDVDVTMKAQTRDLLEWRHNVVVEGNTLALDVPVLVVSSVVHAQVL